MTDQDQSEQERARQLVHREVRVCLSSLVSTLAEANGVLMDDGRPNLTNLTEQAFELASPIEDYEEAAIQAGWRWDEGGSHFYRTGPDGGDFIHTPDCDWAALCLETDLDPYEREVFEHWAVSDWFGRKLADQGEKVDFDFAGMTVWARTTTGQAIYCDGVVERIVADLWKPEPEPTPETEG